MNPQCADRDVNSLLAKQIRFRLWSRLVERAIGLNMGYHAGAAALDRGRQVKSGRSHGARATGAASPERIAALRGMFPEKPWVEVYERLYCGHILRPDRYGGITDADVDRLASLGDIAGAANLELEREFCLARWRTWIGRG